MIKCEQTLKINKKMTKYLFKRRKKRQIRKMIKCELKENMCGIGNEKKARRI